ncbi:MAG: N-acetylmuramoyl-L-alanine amidase [Sphingobacteriaceae bacterium]|nr:N-acetylmuramoyl-L-alanine amidase [Sphingobacteriaceae bacterium]
MKKIKFSILIGLVILLVSVNPLGLKAYKIRTVVIDAGHGGHDSGCLGAAAKEKDVALQIALAFGKMLETNHKDVKVIYTRKDDRFLELHQRASIANKNNADLFISFHLNSASSQAHGTETFTQGLHVTGANLEVSKRENASVLLESDYTANYDGFDPKDPTTHIIFELFQSAYRNQSIRFAEKIETNFEKRAGRFSRGVKQAGFLVLYRTTMPAVLIESGFLTNRNEEKFLTSPEGQQKMAESVYQAFVAYKAEIDKDGK